MQPASVSTHLNETTVSVAEDAVVEKQTATAAQPVKRRKSKSGKTVWIIVGVVVVLAVLRVIIASGKSE
ncbi:hypothetical protein PK28_14565 [Hymenobacter sp. DG25B]|nr:hypothetical protein PK28_14565 [Hymenobacter sp. DG25B]